MKKILLSTCPPSGELADRPLLSADEAMSMEKTFKMLANTTRLRMLHALAIEKEMCVTDLANTLEMSATAISNQLQRMADRGVVTSRREGLNIIYRILDPCAVSVVNHAWCLTRCAENRNNEQYLSGRKTG